LLLRDLDPLDSRALGTLAREGNHAPDGAFVSFHYGLDGALPCVARPPCDSSLLRDAAHRVAKENALHAPVDDEPPAYHRRVGYAPLREPMERLVDRLAAVHIGATFNFYRDGDGADLRRQRLIAYLTEHRGARLLLVGEAAGYRGARVSGIPFTSERQVSGRGPAEATATIVQRVLAELGLERAVVLWNLVPTHPHRPGEPDSNRPPTRAEIAAARCFLDELAARRRVIAVGRLAERELAAPYVRHPSHGGAAAFRSSLIAALNA
jgi:hypothetical protein